MNRLLREACPLEKMFFPENQQTNPVTQRKAVYAMYINNELNATFNSLFIITLTAPMNYSFCVTLRNISSNLVCTGVNSLMYQLFF